MTQSDIWQKINNVWSTIIDIKNRPLSKLWEFTMLLYGQLDWYRGLLQKNLSTNVDELEALTHGVAHQTMMLFRATIDYVDGSLRKAVYDIKRIISPYLKQISDYVEDAVRAVESGGEMDYEYVDNAIARAINSLDTILSGKISYLSSTLQFSVLTLTAAIDDLQTQIDDIGGVSIERIQEMIDDAYNDLWADTLIITSNLKRRLGARIGKVYDYIDDEIFTIYADIDTKYAEVTAYVDTKATEAIDYIDGVVDEINTILESITAEVYAYVDTSIETAISDINTEFASVREEMDNKLWILQAALVERIDYITSELLVAMFNMEMRIMGDVRTIEDRVRIMDAAISWRQVFFGIFMSKPELSFLEVLLRDEEKFAEYKPYWQALLTRVMAED